MLHCGMCCFFVLFLILFLFGNCDAKLTRSALLWYLWVVSNEWLTKKKVCWRVCAEINSDNNISGVCVYNMQNKIACTLATDLWVICFFFKIWYCVWSAVILFSQPMSRTVQCICDMQALGSSVDIMGTGCWWWEGVALKSLADFPDYLCRCMNMCEKHGTISCNVVNKKTVKFVPLFCFN